MVLTADQMLAALNKWGIKYKFYKSDWRSHNRNAVQGWGPYNGHVVHNFGSDTSDPNSLAYLYKGDLARGMPGPLSEFSITDDGMLWIIGWGAANHTGYIEARLHQLVLADAAPLAADYKPTTNDKTGRSVVKPGPHYTGVEMTYGKAPTAAQVRTCELLSAALMDAVGYSAGSVIGHRECTTARSDPVGISMGAHRRAVAALLKAGPAGAKPSTPVKEEDIMASIDDLKKVINSELGDVLRKADGGTIRADLKWQNEQAAKLSGQVLGLSSALASLAAGQGIDLSAVEAAAKAGAQAALDDKISGADVTLAVNPPKV